MYQLVSFYYGSPPWYCPRSVGVKVPCTAFIRTGYRESNITVKAITTLLNCTLLVPHLSLPVAVYGRIELPSRP